MKEPLLQLKSVRIIHTLGPCGTNCEAAARYWLSQNCLRGKVKLYSTLEQAVDVMPYKRGHALLGCAVYPDLHTLVFSNINRLAIADAFVMPTFAMVLASRDGTHPRVAATHPAPQQLVPSNVTKVFVSSNAEAALACAEKRVDGCITTVRAAELHELVVIHNYGEVPMVFTVHVPITEKTV